MNVLKTIATKSVSICFVCLFLSSCATNTPAAFRATPECAAGTYMANTALGTEYYQISYDGKNLNIVYTWLCSNALNIFKESVVAVENATFDEAKNSILFSATLSYDSNYADGKTIPSTEEINCIINSDGLTVQGGETSKLFEKDQFDYDIETVYNAKVASDDYMEKTLYKNDTSIKTFRYEDNFWYSEDDHSFHFYYAIVYYGDGGATFERIGETNVSYVNSSFYVNGFDF